MNNQKTLVDALDTLLRLTAAIATFAMPVLAGIAAWNGEWTAATFFMVFLAVMTYIAGDS